MDDTFFDERLAESTPDLAVDGVSPNIKLESDGLGDFVTGGGQRRTWIGVRSFVKQFLFAQAYLMRHGARLGAPSVGAIWIILGHSPSAPG